MNEQVIHWDAILLFGAILFGWAFMQAIVTRRQARRSRRSRGFRSMKSPNQRIRERSHARH